MKYIAALIAIIFLANVSFASQDLAFQEYYSGNYSSANKELHELAEKNNGEALYYLANMNLYGYGLKKNPTMGLELMTRSAKLNYLPAQMYLGNYYFQQKHELENALQWYKKAAEANDVGAQMFSALAYLNGYGTRINTDVARKYIIMAAKNGVPMAQYELFEMFFSNKHANDKKLALIWLGKAAEKNYPEAQYQLGAMLYRGEGFDKDETAGLEWLKKSAKQGYKDAELLIQKIQHPAENSTAVVAPNTNPEKVTLSNEQQWQHLTELLKRSGITLMNAAVATAANNTITKTPKLVPITKSSIIQTKFTLVNPSEISMDKIISYMSKLNYLQQKPTLHLLSYPFILPARTTNNQQAFQQLSRQADFGYPQGSFLLGQMYEQGLGVEKNEKKAFDYYLYSAEQGYLKAEYMVGIYYLQGRAVERNIKTAVTWLAKSALKGSQQAQFVLGNLYEYGIDQEGNPNFIAKNPPMAQAMYSLAAESGLAIAQYRLAQLYASGILNPDNNSEVQKNDVTMAYKLFQAAAKQGVKKAQIVLSYFYARPGQSEKLQEQAFSTAEDAASLENPNATLLLAILYDRGIGTRESHRKALKYYKKLAESDNAISQFMLGTYYCLDGDVTDGIRLLEKAASAGDMYAQYNLAILNQQGKYQQPGENFVSLLTKAADNNFNKASILLADYYLMSTNDPAAIKQAADIYQKLAEKQNSAAELKLGFMYENGIYFEKNIEKSYQWYSQAATHNNPTAQYLVGNMFQLGKGVKRNIDEAITFYLKSATQNYIPAEVALGFVYEIYKNDYTKAQAWYLKAAEKNNPEAQYDLALMYEYGKGTKINTSKSHQLYKEAAKNGYITAEMSLAKHYLMGRNADSDLAKKWYQKAARKNNAEALYYLGLINETGVGQTINLPQAFTYYQQAAERGNTKAMLAVARFYNFGIGIPTNKTLATEYYQKAANAGNQFAKITLTGENHNLPYCVKPEVMVTKKSLWRTLTNWFKSKPNRSYMQAMNCLNEGALGKASAYLTKIITNNPNFHPARNTLSHYLCSQSLQKTAAVTTPAANKTGS